MFNEVKILDGKGKVKKVLSGESLSRKYWKAFSENPMASKGSRKGRGRKAKKSQALKDKFDIKFDDSCFSEDLGEN